MDGLNLSQIETPTVLVDHERLLRNIEWVQGLAAKRALRLRPHIKTHKCLEIAQLQLDRGAVGLTASKVDEALVFIESGVRSITVAYPILDPRKLERLLTATEHNQTDLGVVVDGSLGADRLIDAAGKTGRSVAALIEIDVGLHRCGLAEDDPTLIELARAIRASRNVEFAGLLSHAGHAYGASTVEEIAEIAAEECNILKRARARLENAGIPVPEVSIGSTPTVLASTTFEAITEIRPGNYVFLDRTAVRLGLAGLERVALTVLATVVSRNESFLIVDAGSKVLSSDRGAHGTDQGEGYGAAFPLEQEWEEAAALKVVKLSEEHGFVERGSLDVPIGTKLRIVPNHACPVVNLAEHLTIVSGDHEIARWPVAARGKVR
ncbi:MAG: alanine racemase [Chthoniobacterales bacterium]